MIKLAKAFSGSRLPIRLRPGPLERETSVFRLRLPLIIPANGKLHSFGDLRLKFSHFVGRGFGLFREQATLVCKNETKKNGSNACAGEQVFGRY